jgi:hypothetical protein
MGFNQGGHTTKTMMLLSIGAANLVYFHTLALDILIRMRLKIYKGRHQCKILKSTINNVPSIFAQVSLSLSLLM